MNRRREGVGHSPRLMPVWIAAPTAIAVASALGWVLYQHVQGSPAVRGAAPLDIVRTTVTLAAAVGAVLTGVYAYRKQRLSEGDAARADDDQLTQKYSTAAEQLGHDKAAVRLAGVFAMARLADDWTKQRQECIDVLCAYLRMPTEHDSGLSEREVRATIVRTIELHLRQSASISWSGNDFDFTGAAFQDSHFDGVTFSGMRTNFDRATFSGKVASFRGAIFSGMRTSFDEATFSAERTIFEWAFFNGPFSVEFPQFDHPVTFDRATFSGKLTSFKDASFLLGGTTADEATEKASFMSPSIVWGPISPRVTPPRDEEAP